MESQKPARSHVHDKRGGHHATHKHQSNAKATDGDATELTAGPAPARGEAVREAEDAEVRRGSTRGGLVGAFLALLDEGISSCCNLRDALGRTALHEAAEQGDSDVAKILLDAGALIDPRCRCKVTPLMLAAQKGHGDVVRLLLRAGADGIDRHDDDDNSSTGPVGWRSTALHHAAKGGHVDVVSTLLDAGFQRQQHDETGLTPAEVSARAGLASSPAATRRLLAAGDDRGGQLLHDYVNMVTEDVGIVRGLVDGGAFLDWQDDVGGETALHRAAHFGHARITHILLRAGARVNLRNVRGGSPLHVAASTGCATIVAALLEAGAHREARMDNGRSPLHLAVINNKPDAVLLLLRAGANTEHRDFERGQTPLSEASEYALAPIIRLLLDAGADVGSRSTAGLTALHWACRFNSPDSVAVLLAAGADPDAVEKAASAPAALEQWGDTARLPACSQPTPRCALERTAAEVIGFGDPSRSAEDPRRPFMGELRGAAERRLDPAAQSRVSQLLHDARKDRAWRRRGWLVVLVKRRDDDARASVSGKSLDFDAGDVVGGSDGVGSRHHGGQELNVIPQGRKKRTWGAVGVPQQSAMVGKEGGNGALTGGGPSSYLEGARLGRVGPALDDEAKRAAGRDSAMLHAEERPGRRVYRSQLLVCTIESLLELASVEAGVFRNVLSYV
eukprot:g4370.t1